MIREQPVRVSFPGRNLLPFVVLALGGFSVLPALGGEWPRPALIHMMLAAGMFPLILAVMTWLVGTLTRTRGMPPWWIRMVPYLAAGAGMIAVTALWHDLTWVLVAVPVAVLAVLLLLVWMGQQARRAVGGYHPCLLWYLSALFCLTGGLLAIAGGVLWPEYWQPLRTIHLHLNLVGFVGITAVGTLHVLLPTVAGYAVDAGLAPGAMRQFDLLHVHWRYVLLGSWMAALGSAFWRPLSWMALPLWVIPLWAVWVPVWRHRRQFRLRQGAAVSLLGALLGFVLLLFAGIPIVLKWMAAEDAVPLFFIAFLLPLVTGAMTHLLPLWIWPAEQADRQRRMGAALARGALLRTVVLLGASLALLAGLRTWALGMAVAVLGVFVLQVITGFVITAQCHDFPGQDGCERS
jgi:hypothetical protein